MQYALPCLFGLIIASCSSADDPSPVGSPVAPGGCMIPGVCKPPPAKYTNVLPIRPRQQWNTAGGFCGSLSIQVLGMGFGMWASQDMIRKANVGAPCFGHGRGSPGEGNGNLGCEVGPENYNQTASGLNLIVDIWDYEQPTPQATAFKAWIKAHLVKGEPVMWVPICKGDSHTPYGPASCPGGGHFDHHEPIVGFGSNHSLNDSIVYDDDWLLHFSAQDLQTYYRTFRSLEDSTRMDGNCRDALAMPGQNEMYPCFYEKVTYGVAAKGLNLGRRTERVTIDVNHAEEPNIRNFSHPVQLHATVTVHGLRAGQSYVLSRYAGLPSKGTNGLESQKNFTASGETWRHVDPHSFLSSSAVYWVAEHRAARS